MASFINAMAKAQGFTPNEKGVAAYTDKGVKSDKVGYEGSQMVALYNRLVGSRAKSKCGITRENLITLFNSCYEDILQIQDSDTKKDCLTKLITLVFETRDIKLGKGERDLFYWLFLRLFEDFPSTAVNTISLVTGGADEVLEVKLEDEPLGSFKDVNRLCEIMSEDKTHKYEDLEEALINHYVYNLARDAQEDKAGLAGKWAPRENKETDKKCGLAKKLAKRLSHKKKVQEQLKDYRKLIASLNEKIKTPEVLMCKSKETWGELEIFHFASRAFNKYKKALLDVDKKGNRKNPNDIYREKVRNKVLAEFEKIKEDPSKSRLNVGKLQSYEIVAEILNGNIHTDEDKNMVNSIWKKYVSDFRSELQEQFVPGVSLVDVSGSMSNVMPMAISLGLLTAELMEGPFKDKVLLFTDNAEWFDLSVADNLYDKTKLLARAAWGGSTNISSAIDNILTVGVENKVPQEDMPKCLYIYSDMMFDQADNGYEGYYSSYGMNQTKSINKYTGKWSSNHDSLKESYNKAGYEMPLICYWNMRDCGSTVCKSDCPGTVCMSGFSPNLLKEFLKGNFSYTTTPWENLSEKLTCERYKPIRDIVEICGEVEDK
jgi:hypothetical protein